MLPIRPDPTAARHTDPQDVGRLLAGSHDDPFAVLGMHGGNGRAVVVRCFWPGARQVQVLDQAGAPCATLRQIDAGGFFEGSVDTARERFDYRLRVRDAHGEQDVDDPYAFAPLLGELDTHLFGQGAHWRLYDVLGAHPRIRDGVAGTDFAVWAPNAQRVSVVGAFNGWDGRRHVMRRRPEAGLWELFLPGVGEGELYKFEVRDRHGHVVLKSDPVAFRSEMPPSTASRVCAASSHTWSDEGWMRRRVAAQAADAPVSIYEVHLDSWRRHPDGRAYSYDELADALVPYARNLGFTHLELLPVSEYPFSGSWGYQPTALYAPSSRWGDPDGLRRFIDRCHAAGLGVLLDWVPAHFPRDAHGLARFDGTCLYEHEDPRRGTHEGWGTLVYNFGRHEVANFLIANALYWLREFHVDGLRVDAVASMLYLDYDREPGQWLANAEGGHEDLEAVAFLRRCNEIVHAEAPPGAIMVAEESTSWPGVTRSVPLGGLGFDYKWNMGWMNDTLAYMQHDPVHRKYHHDRLTFGLLYAFSERFVLPLSHDEVVHGKGSLLGKMPGDRWQQLANLRLYLAFQSTQPGKKLLFMGGELAQEREWNHDAELDWGLLTHAGHAGVQRLVGDLNRLYRERPCLHRHDCDGRGFRWIDCNDSEQSVLVWRRLGDAPRDTAIVVCNFTPVPRLGYRIGVPFPGVWREVLNTDASDYGGSGVGNAGAATASATPWHGEMQSLVLSLPPLAALVLVPADAG